MENKYDKLQEEYINLKEDYKVQESMASDIRMEATGLLEEVKLLNHKNEMLHGKNQELMKQKEKDEQLMAELRREVIFILYIYIIIIIIIIILLKNDVAQINQRNGSL